MRTGLTIDARFCAHVPPGPHPERPERLVAIEAALAQAGLLQETLPMPARAATRDELIAAHDPAFIDALVDRIGGAVGDGLEGGTEGAANRDRAAWGFLDPDTYYCAGSWEAALLAAGAVLDLAMAVRDGALDDGIAFVRPPGHHATRDRSMGFCLINNVAIAAAVLVAEGARVAIVDFDVHHGNGTQDIFYGDGRVLYCSTHQYPFYPGSGAVAERGVGPGLGATVNVPLPEGASDRAFIAAYDDVILPAITKFRPDLVIASAGFDAHCDDPLASLRVTDAGFAVLVRRLMTASGGRLAMALEGGYDLRALARCAVVTVEALLGRPLAEAANPERWAPMRDEDRRAIAAARRSLEELAPPSP